MPITSKSNHIAVCHFIHVNTLEVLFYTLIENSLPKIIYILPSKVLKGHFILLLQEYFEIQISTKK